MATRVIERNSPESFAIARRVGEAEVRRMLDEGKSTNEIARAVDVCQATVSRIKRGAGRYA